MLVLDATVFEYSNHPTKITTIGQCGSYNDGDSKKKKGTITSMLRESSSLIREGLQTFFGEGNTVNNHTIGGVNENKIRILCRRALDQAHCSRKHSMNDISSPKETLVIYESEAYRLLLDKVGREQARRVNDIIEQHAVIIGAVLLGQAQAPKEIGHGIKDKIAFDLLRACGEEQGIVVADKSFPLPSTNKTCMTTLPRICKKIKMFQPSIDCSIPVGNLSSVKEWFPSTHEIEPNFELSNEGIETKKIGTACAWGC